jgi:hypothetical protein
MHHRGRRRPHRVRRCRDFSGGVAIVNGGSRIAAGGIGIASGGKAIASAGVKLPSGADRIGSRRNRIRQDGSPSDPTDSSSRGAASPSHPPETPLRRTAETLGSTTLPSPATAPHSARHRLLSRMPTTATSDRYTDGAAAPPIWARPDPPLAAAGIEGECVVARVRLFAMALLLIAPDIGRRGGPRPRSVADLRRWATACRQACRPRAVRRGGMVG